MIPTMEMVCGHAPQMERRLMLLRGQENWATGRLASLSDTYEKGKRSHTLLRSRLTTLTLATVPAALLSPTVLPSAIGHPVQTVLGLTMGAMTLTMMATDYLYRRWATALSTRYQRTETRLSCLDTNTRRVQGRLDVVKMAGAPAVEAGSVKVEEATVRFGNIAVPRNL